MSLEEGRSTEARRGNEVDLRVNHDGRMWYRDTTNNEVVVLDEASDAEYNRQQMNPGSEPTQGYPRFNRGIMLEDIPSDNTEPQQPASADAQNQQQDQPQSAPAPGPGPAPAPGPAPIPQPAPADAAEARQRSAQFWATGGLDPNSISPEDLRRLGYSEEDVRDWRRIQAGGGGQPPQEPPSQNRGGETRRDGPRFGGGGTEGTQAETGRAFDWRSPDARRYVGLTPKSVRDIVANPQDQRLFGELLQNMDERASERVFERMLDRTTTQADLSFLNAAAKEFALRQKVVEEINATVPREMEILARWNPKLGDLVGNEGLPRATEMVKNMITHMAMRREPGQGDGFSNIQDLNEWFKQLSRDRQTNRAKAEEKRVRALCERVGINPLDYKTVFNMNSMAGRRATTEQLTRMIHERAGKFRRAMDWLQTSFPPSVRRPHEGRLGSLRNWMRTMPDVGSGIPLPGSSRFAAWTAMTTADQIDKNYTYHMALSNAVERLDVNLKNIAGYLGTTVDDDDLRNLVAREVQSNQNQALASEGGPQTFAQVQEMTQNRYSETSMENRIRQRIQETPDWRDWTDTQKDTAINSWGREEKREWSAWKGFWAWLFSKEVDRNWGRAAQRAKTPR